jgi:hypothetical protein
MRRWREGHDSLAGSTNYFFITLKPTLRKKIVVETKKWKEIRKYKEEKGKERSNEMLMSRKKGKDKKGIKKQSQKHKKNQILF